MYFDYTISMYSFYDTVYTKGVTTNYGGGGSTKTFRKNRTGGGHNIVYLLDRRDHKIYEENFVQVLDPSKINDKYV